MLDLIGKVFGRLTVIEKTSLRDHNSIVWLCKCKCGNTTKLSARDLTTGNRRGCGRCADSSHPLYTTWRGILTRCLDKNSPSYKDYGARGITVCTEWRKDFLSFLSDMGPKPSSQHSIERINNDGNYCKENCVWATYKEQNRNKRKQLSAKLCDTDIINIFLSLEKSSLLAAQFNVAQNTVANIRSLQYSAASQLVLAKFFSCKNTKLSILKAKTLYLLEKLKSEDNPHSDNLTKN